MLSEDSYLLEGLQSADKTRNSSGDEITNVNFLYDDIVPILQNTIDSCINSATDPWEFSCVGMHVYQIQ